MATQMTARLTWDLVDTSVVSKRRQGACRGPGWGASDGFVTSSLILFQSVSHLTATGMTSSSGPHASFHSSAALTFWRTLWLQAPTDCLQKTR